MQVDEPRGRYLLLRAGSVGARKCRRTSAPTTPERQHRTTPSPADATRQIGMSFASQGQDSHIVGVGRECFEILGVARQDCAAGLGEGCDEGIDGRASSGMSSQLGCPPSQ